MPRGPAIGTAVTAAWVTILAACTDLFHSTDDIRTACAIDAATAGCSIEGGVDSSSSDAGGDSADFCAWSSEEARARAAHACAWLGACAGPLGGNAFGACTVQARLAFDCAANPDHVVHGRSHDRWACLAAASTCDGVRQCFLPEPVRCEIPGDYVECAVDGGDVRVECVATDAAVRIEDCSLWGQTCVSSGASARCGPSAAPVDCTEARGACDNSARGGVRWCDADGGQTGIDCSGNGAQACGAFADDSGAEWPACTPETDAAAPCTASLSVQCANGVAHTCAAGFSESIDCASLLGSADACTGISLSPPFDWTSACALTTPCAPDSCAGTVLTSCARGATFSVDCSDAGLGRCNVVATDLNAAARAACAPP
jgi:hypothetical protein